MHITCKTLFLLKVKYDYMYYIYLIKYFINATIVACFDFSAKYTELGFFYTVSIEMRVAC